MKKLILVTLILLASCETLQIDLRSPVLKNHTETVQMEYDAGKNEEVWSRANYYIHAYLGYALEEYYNPYYIKVTNEKPVKEITITREIAGNKILLKVRYTAAVKIKKSTGEEDETPENPDDIPAMKRLIEDFFIYIETGGHKYEIRKSEKAGKKSKKQPGKKLNSKEHFFFY